MFLILQFLEEEKFKETVHKYVFCGFDLFVVALACVNLDALMTTCGLVYGLTK